MVERERLKQKDEAVLASEPLRPSSKSERKFSQVQPSTLPLEDEEGRVLFLRKCVAPHVQSFDFAVGNGLSLIAEDIDPVLVRGPAPKEGDPSLIVARVHSLSVVKPRLHEGSYSVQYAATKPLYPGECRRTGSTYSGELYGAFTIVLDDKETIEVPAQRIAKIPIMVGSTACNLREMDRSDLVAHGEEEYEVGGSFIINGTEKVIRLVVVPRCNHAISAERAKNASRGPLFSDLSLSYKSVRRDQSSTTIHFHLLRSGAVRVRVRIGRNEFFIPAGILMRAFLPSGTTDRDIYEMIIGGETEDSALCNAAVSILKELSESTSRFNKTEAEDDLNPAISKSAATAYLGKQFRAVLGIDDPSVSDLEAGIIFLRKHILVHLSVTAYEDPNDSFDRSKADLIVLLVRKLIGTSTGDVEVDNADAISHQSVLTSGQLYLNLLKEKLEVLLKIFTALIRRESEKYDDGRAASGMLLKELVTESLSKALKSDQITKQMNYLLATGNLTQNTTLDLPQTVGYAVVAERINFFRYICHFRAIHRGAFYAAMRSTKVRKLLPEAWGFVCPVHTPDGDPCGILNHLAAEAIVTQGPVADRRDMLDLFSDFNFTPAPALSSIQCCSPKGSLPIVVDGRVLGFVARDEAEQLSVQLRYTKVRDAVQVLPNTSEITYIAPVASKSGFAPGIYVHTGGSRYMRPVRWLHTPARKVVKEGSENQGLNEWIGTLEQVFLRVRPVMKDPDYNVSRADWADATHSEISQVAFLSVLASLAPFPEMNQGPRNMFQCQMAKQAMGTPCHTIWSRMESKIYRHTTPQVPITRNFCTQDPMGADYFPNGVNAIVAVISYTGNDMEDALIINKSSLERGFAHGTVYMNERVDLDTTIEGRESSFRSLTDAEANELKTVDIDGLPAVGTRLEKGDVLYGTCLNNGARKNDTTWKRYKSVEKGTVDEVLILNNSTSKTTKGGNAAGMGIRTANIRTRVSRPPCVGDKFASRAGQKGTMSAAWPLVDMPFSESGMVPDILFNPNGFPSRMTIGMMVEIMSGKSGALHGRFNDSTPFVFDDKHRAVDYFAEQLVKAGYDYCGSETLYSGYTGEPFKVNIFMGIVHYQRLRHMVSDKFQVRTTGAIHPLFRQPIKGRKKGGAIRFGEMERDGLLAHGASFLLRDRLAMASDLHILHVCERCCSLLSPIAETEYGREVRESDLYCMVCKDKSAVQRVAIPYSFKYLANELAAMNIRTVLALREVA